VAWRVLLSDDRTGVVVPIFAVEEPVASSPKPLCDYCRWAGEFPSSSIWLLACLAVRAAPSPFEMGGS
jgi:hypothetical protein